MAVYPKARIVRGVLEYTMANGGTAVNVIHFGVKGSSTVLQADIDDCVEALQDLTKDTYSTFKFGGILSHELTIVQASARSIGLTIPLESEGAIAEVGQQTGESLPLESSVVVTHYTDRADRSGRGRSYVPGLSVNDMANGVMLPAAVTAHALVWNSWQAAIQAETTIDPVVYSPTHLEGRSFVSSIVRPTVHHQKRRNS